MRNYTLVYNDETKSLAEWGISEAQLAYANCQPDVLTMGATANVVDADVFSRWSYLDLYFGDTRIFRGQVVPSAQAQGGRQRKVYTVHGGWKELMTRQYLQYQTARDDAGFAYTIPTPRFLSQFLFTNYQADPPSACMEVKDYLTMVLQFCIETGLAPLQIGTIEGAGVLAPCESVQDVSVGEIISRSLRFMPGGYVSFDYSTDPVTINVHGPSSLSPVTVPLGAFTDLPTIDQSFFRLVKAVTIFFHQADYVNTAYDHRWSSAQYPPEGDGIPIPGQEGNISFTLDDTDIADGGAISTIAQQLYEGMLHYQWAGNGRMMGADVPRTVGLGNLLNISGGNADWATMNGLVQRVTDDLKHGTRTLQWGPPMALSAADLAKFLWGARTRAPARPDAKEAAATGQSGGPQYGFGGDQGAPTGSGPKPVSTKVEAVVNVGGVPTPQDLNVATS